MGNVPLFGKVHLYRIYRRRIDTDKYELRPFIEVMREGLHNGNIFGIFKHEVFDFGLNTCRTMKCIYLYRNSWRLAKCTILGDNTLMVSFNNVASRNAYDEEEERLGPRRWPLIERAFLRRYCRDVEHPCELEVCYIRK